VPEFLGVVVLDGDAPVDAAFDDDEGISENGEGNDGDDGTRTLILLLLLSIIMIIVTMADHNDSLFF